MLLFEFVYKHFKKLKTGLDRGWGVPHTGGGGTPSQVGGTPPSSDQGGTSSQVQMGVPLPRSGWGVPILGLGGQGTPSQVRMGGTPSQVQDWMQYPPPHPGLDGVPPPPHHQETDQHNEHLLRGGRYASCVDAGLSCDMKVILTILNVEFGLK